MDKRDSDLMLELLQLIFDDVDTVVRYEQMQPYFNKHMRTRRLKKAESIVTVGETVQYIHILLTGGAYIQRQAANGSVTTISRVPAPEMIGNVQIFSKDPLFYSDIVASEETLLLEIESKYFHDCVAENAPLAVLVLSTMASAQQRSSTRLEVARIPDSADKLIVYLYRRWAEKGLPQKGMRINDNHATIASDIGVSVRTLYRAINKLAEDRLLAVDKGGVWVLTLEQLEEIAGRFRQVTVPWDE